MKDVFGKALRDFYNNNYTEDIVTSTNISDEDVLPISYLFRTYTEMPMLEQKALELAKGYVLDVGCGAGSHTLYLQHKKYKIKAIDVSEAAVQVCKKRGILHVETKALLDETDTFDTILLLMNGTGIFEDMTKLLKYLKHLKSLLKPNGQILIDSSDIKYMYEDDAENEFEAENGNRYYGALDYFLSYKGEEEIPLKWLYLDFETLKKTCKSAKLNCEKIADGPHYDYLARLYYV